MRNGHLSLLAIALITQLAACSRHDGGNDCISRPPLENTTLLSSAQMDTVDNLFSQNNLSTSGLQFSNIFYNTSIVSPGYSGPLIQVVAEQWINGLPLFGGVAYFSFGNGVYQSPSAGLYQGAPPGGDTIGHRGLEDLRQAFLQNYKQCTISGGPANSKPSHPTAPYQDSCLYAVLGYIDAFYAGTGIPYGQQLIKVWVVAGQSSNYASMIAEGISPYPAVFVVDSTGYAWPQDISIP
jgi:hypothetical protein